MTNEPNKEEVSVVYWRDENGKIYKAEATHSDGTPWAVTIHPDGKTITPYKVIQSERDGKQ